jgi:diguanylate cyclase (GGDEF)-like protein
MGHSRPIMLSGQPEKHLSMSEPIGEVERSAQAMAAVLPGYAPYGQLIKMLLPRSTGVAIYDRMGSLSWSSNGYEKPEFRELVDRYGALQHDAGSGGALRATSSGHPAFFACIQSGRRRLGSVIVELGQTKDVWNEKVIAGLLTPVLRCLENRLALERSIDFAAVRSDQALDLLLEADEDNPEGPSPLHRLLQHTIKHLGCSLGALVITDKNLVVTCDSDGNSTKASSEILNRTQKNLLAWAQLNNRPMLVNRVGPHPDSVTYKILSCPVRNTQEQVNGVLALFRETTQDDFDLKDVRILEFIARRAVAILHTRHDPLTGLVNRLIFERRVQEQLRARGTASSHTILYIDIDYLQTINEAFGYQVGDEVIQRLGEAVQQQLRPADMASRLGGDRVALYLHDRGPDAARQVAEDLVLQIGQLSYIQDDETIPVSISIGMVSVQPGPVQFSHVLAAAELACKEAKREGRNRVVMGHAADIGQSSERSGRTAAANLQQALDENEFRLEALPIRGVSISTGEIMGHEILLRLRDFNGQLVAPDKFIDAARRYGLMGAIDRWVVINAAHTLKQSGISYTDPANRITLNVSEESLKTEGFTDFVLEELLRARLPAQAFRFDIKESAAINDMRATEVFIRELSEAGCQVGLDDFGIGLSSFANLKVLPVKYLKIDGSLTRRSLTDPYAESVIKGIVKTAEILGLFTIAEHVETEAIALRLRDLDVNFGQGYHFGRPKPLAQTFTS